jgi:hypothetical protein
MDGCVTGPPWIDFRLPSSRRMARAISHSRAIANLEGRWGVQFDLSPSCDPLGGDVKLDNAIVQSFRPPMTAYRSIGFREVFVLTPDFRVPRLTRHPFLFRSPSHVKIP